jgi:hypothetical protein
MPPSSDQVWRAIETYLRVVYADGGALPAGVQQRLDQLRQAGQSPLDCPAVERDDPREPRRYLLRLGNRFYPHMKLVVDGSRDAWLYRADTHDAHCRPREGSGEMAAYEQLCTHNRDLAAKVDQAFADAGLPTFKSMLRDDLARRAAGA